MDEGQVEDFVAAAERDYRTAVDGYCSILGAEWHWDVAELREARADVLAAQEVLDLARTERRIAQQAQEHRERAAQPHEGWCERCFRAGQVRAWGDAELCDVCHEQARCGEEAGR